MIDLEKLKGHTKGPWKNGFYQDTVVTDDENELIIAEHVEQKNRPIIAAAPDLLEENEKLREVARIAREFLVAEDNYLHNIVDYQDEGTKTKFELMRTNHRVLNQARNRLNHVLDELNL